MAGAPTPRSMFISAEIHQFLESDHPLAGAARADLERFILGKRIVVALYRDHKDCLMARLDSPSDGVWELRILDSDPQLRIFGQFAARDVFVALVGPIEHEYVVTDEEFEEYKKDCRDNWVDLFGFAYFPVRRSDDVDDYISKPVRLI